MKKQEFKKGIGERLRRFRNHLEYTQDKFASFLAVTPANISRIECGDILPATDMLQWLSKELNLSLHWLLCNEGEMKKTDRREINVNYPQSEELEEFLICLGKVPKMRKALLTFFSGFKAKCYEIISESIIKNNSNFKQNQRSTYKYKGD